MKIILNVQSGSLSGKSFELETGSLILGRGPDCGMQFAGPGEEGVSKRHAVIQAEADGFCLIDQSSTNGSFVNGTRTMRTKLKTGDVIRLGQSEPHVQVQLAADLASEGIVQGAPPQLEPPAGSVQAVVGQLGIYNPEKESHTDRGILGTAAVLGMMCIGLFCLGVAVLFYAYGTGIGPGLLGGAVAFGAAPFYIGLWLWLDRFDPEPPWALAGAFAWGAGVVIVAAVVLEGLFGLGVSQFVSPTTAPTLVAVISAPIVEEGFKGLGVLLIFLFLRREFDGVLDGIVYAGVIALGYAASENMGYYAMGLHAGGTAFAQQFVFRGMIGAFMHALFTSMTGIGCGISRESHNRIVKVIAPVMGYCCAMFLHAMWNFTSSELGTAGELMLYVIVYVPLFFILLGFVLYLSYRESKLLRAALAPEVEQGLITPAQLATICSYFRRLGWVFGSITDLPRFTARRKYLRAATKLGFCYWHVNAAARAHGRTVSGSRVPYFRNQLVALKGKV